MHKLDLVKIEKTMSVLRNIAIFSIALILGLVAVGSTVTAASLEDISAQASFMTANLFDLKHIPIC